MSWALGTISFLISFISRSSINCIHIAILCSQNVTDVIILVVVTKIYEEKFWVSAGMADLI